MPTVGFLTVLQDSYLLIRMYLIRLIIIMKMVSAETFRNWHS